MPEPPHDWNDPQFPRNPHSKWTWADLDSRISALSDQQLLTLAMIADGASNGEIADQLGVSNKTLEKQTPRLFDAIGVSNRIDAAVAYTVWKSPQAFPEVQPNSQDPRTS